ncbi:endolytic transglycosylase MltG [Lactovum odontotermitis]
MAHDSNSDTSIEDFFNEGFGKEPESESQQKTGAPIFADQKVPDDIMAAAQQAMFEQGSLTGEASGQTSELSQELVKDTTDTANDSKEDSDHSLKISKVRYIDDLPKEKIKTRNPKLKNTTEPQPIQPATSASATTAASPVEHPEPAEQDPAEKLKEKHSDTHSFRDEIMARLHSETESYKTTDNISVVPLSTKRPSVPAATEKSKKTEKIEKTGKESSSSAFPTKEEFLAAAGSKPKNMPRQFASAGDKADTQPVRPASSRVGFDDDDDDDYSVLSRAERRQSKREDKMKHGRQSKVHIGRSIAIILILVVLALGGFGYFFVTDNLKAVNPKDKSALVVDIPESTSFKDVAQILKKNDLIKNTMVFTVYTRYKGLSDFKSGYYTLNKSMTPAQIAKTLEKGGKAASPAEGKITIPEGYTIDQIATAFTVNAASKTSEKTPFSQADFLNVVKDPSFIAEMTAKYPQLFANLPAADSGVKYQLEGYLFPATYDYNASTTAKSIVEQMIATMDQNLQPYYAQIPSLGLNVNSLLSLSALVEKEANTEEERKNVADVFLKRLNEGWTLGSNVALLYAEGRLGTKITAADDANLDTTMDSPYNLYQVQGTGPGPIASPSAMSIAAVMNHTSNPYYYFYADPSTGTIYFAETQEEQDANQQQHSGTTSAS